MNYDRPELVPWWRKGLLRNSSDPTIDTWISVYESWFTSIMKYLYLQINFGRKLSLPPIHFTSTTDPE